MISAGLLLHIRDVICPQFKVNLDQSSDLHESTLTACSTLMLAQASECIYEKANDGILLITTDETSSPVTALVAVYTSDLYDVCERKSSAGKPKFPNMWGQTMKAKCQLFGAISHFHTGPLISNDRAVAERMTRLDVARLMITASQSHSEKIGGALHDVVTVTSVLNSAIR